MKAEWQETMGEMGCKAKKVVKDKKIVSPKSFVADIWHVLSYHSISKLGEIIYLSQIEYINMRGDDFHSCRSQGKEAMPLEEPGPCRGPASAMPSDGALGRVRRHWRK